MAFSAIASVASGIMGARSARRAANAQQQAAERDMEFQRETRDLIFERMDPFFQSGIAAQNALAFESGIGARPGTASAMPAMPAIETFTETIAAPSAPQMPEFGPGRGGEERRQEWENAQRMMRLAGGSQPSTVTRYRVGGNTFNTLEEAQAFARTTAQHAQQAAQAAQQAQQAAQAGQTGSLFENTPAFSFLMDRDRFQTSPGYQFAMEEGTNAVNALAGARGGLNSGRTMQDLTRFGQGLANQEYGTYINRLMGEYNNYLTRLSGIATGGQNAAGAMGNAATNTAAGVSNALAGIGNAQSAGAIGVGNAFQNTFSNLAGLNQYQRNVTGQNAPGMNFGNANWARGMTGNQLLPPRF